MDRAEGSWSALGWIGFAWGIGGVVLLLAWTVARLGGHAIDALSMGLGPVEAGAAVAMTVFMAYSEGYRGFQHAFSPRLVGRALSVARAPHLGVVLAAPLFCMGFFGATRRRMVISWTLTGVIVLLVVAVRLLPQPWRGVVDLGVVVGLAWGILSILWFTGAALRGRPPRVALDLSAPV